MVLPTLTAVHDAAHRFLPPALRQFVKFGIVGSAGFIVDFGTYLLLTRLVGWRTVLRPLGYEIIAPNLVSVLLAMLAVFLLNKYWTFRDPRPEEIAQQGARFFALYATTYVLNQILTSFFAFRVRALEEAFGTATDLVAKVLAIALILLVNFTGSKFVVFRGVGEQGRHRAR